MIKKSTKIRLGIAGVLLIVLGVVCIANPAATFLSTAWLIGCLTLISGISRLVFTCRTQAFLPNSGTRMLSSILLIVMGVIILGHNLFVAISLPVLFSVWVLVEGILIAVQSFDYKKADYSGWWGILILGIVGAILGLLGMCHPIAAGATLSWMIGCGIILLGIAYLLALSGIKRLEKTVAGIRSNIREAIDKR